MLEDFSIVSNEKRNLGNIKEPMRLRFKSFDMTQVNLIFYQVRLDRIGRVWTKSRQARYHQGGCGRKRLLEILNETGETRMDHHS